MHNALERLCLDKAVLDVVLTKYFESRCDLESRQSRYVSVREWRMFLHAADQTVVFLSTVRLIVPQLTCTAIRMHAYFTHSLQSHTTFSVLPEQEIGSTRTRHFFMMAKTAQTDTFSRPRSSLRLCQADSGRRIATLQTVCE